MNKEKPSIQLIEQEYPFEQRENRSRRIFYWLFASFLTAGVLGLFGNGILSQKTVEDKDFILKYERFLRTDTPSKLEITFKNTENPLTVTLNTEYLEQVDIQNVIPQSESVEVTEDGHVCHFKVKGGVVISV